MWYTRNLVFTNKNYQRPASLFSCFYLFIPNYIFLFKILWSMQYKTRETDVRQLVEKNLSVELSPFSHVDEK